MKKTKVHGVALLLDDPLKVEMSKEEETWCGNTGMFRLLTVRCMTLGCPLI
jgi:hypothetical protein